MSCLSWNYRGLGNPQTEDELIALVSNKDPKIVFLMETKLEKIPMERIGCKMQFNNIFVVPCVNMAGGLVLLWREEINLDIQTYSNHHIDAFINHGMDDAWRFTSFYGDPNTTSWENSWSLLKALSHRSNYPSVAMGHFNEIILAEEKQGGLDRPEAQMQSFRDALDFCRLKDLGFNGFPFSWCNRRPGDQNVWIRLYGSKI